MKCPRSYYYLYIGSWGGWSQSASELYQRLYHLKYLTSPDWAMIQIVREAIAGIFSRAISGIRNSPEEEIETVKRTFSSHLERSKSIPLREVDRKKTKLLTDFLGKPLKKVAVKRLSKQLITLLRGFYFFLDVRDLISSPSGLLPEFLCPGESEISHHFGVPSRMEVDPVWIGKGGLVVSRWCTGSPSRFHGFLALTMDIYIRARLRISDDRIVEHRYYYLESGHCISRTFDSQERAEHRKRIRREFIELQSFSEDEKINTGSLNRFSARASHRCTECQFQTVCGESRNDKIAQEEKRELAVPSTQINPM